jgi:hypothetical protein
MSKKMTNEKKMIAFISCQMNTDKIHMLTLALIGRRSLNCEKRGYGTQRASEQAKSDPCSLPHLKESGVLPLNKLRKWTMTICKKSLQWQAS